MEPRTDQALVLDNSAVKEDKPTPKRMTPFKPMKIKNKPGAKQLNFSMSGTEEKQKKPQGPSKLLAFQEKVKNRKYEAPVTLVKEPEDDSYSDDYEEDGFESDDDKKDIKKALQKENRKALKFNDKLKPKINNNNNSFLTGNNGDSNRDNLGSRGSNKPRLQTPEKGFSEGTKLVLNKRKITAGAANKQQERIQNLVPIIQIETEEYDNQLNIKPQTSQDLYFNKLQTFKIQNEMVQTNDDNISRDIQTDAIEEKEVQAQAPEDLFSKNESTKSQGTQDLGGFIQRVTPVMEMICEENVQLADLVNPSAKDKNPVEQKAKISFPIDL